MVQHPISGSGANKHNLSAGKLILQPITYVCRRVCNVVASIKIRANEGLSQVELKPFAESAPSKISDLYLRWDTLLGQTSSKGSRNTDLGMDT